MCFQSPSGCEYLLITPDRSLVFPSVEYVRNVVSKAGMKQGSSSVPVVIDSRHIQGADFTAAKVSNEGFLKLREGMCLS
jgi:sodium-independent sulfate anion transporter 11